MMKVNKDRKIKNPFPIFPCKCHDDTKDDFAENENNFKRLLLVFLKEVHFETYKFFGAPKLFIATFARIDEWPISL